VVGNGIIKIPLSRADPSSSSLFFLLFFLAILHLSNLEA